MTARQERHERFAKLDVRLQRLHAEHPLWFALLSLAMSLVILTIAMLMEEVRR